MKRLLFIFILTIVSFYGYSEDKIKIRLFTDFNVTSLIFTPLSNGYTLSGNDSVLTEIPINQIVNITYEGGKVRLVSGGKNYGCFKTIQLLKKGFINSFELKIVKPDKKPLNFDDGLIVNTLDKGLLILNYINIDYYVAGVVEAEGGTKAPMEYYKTQAILCRTYVLSHYFRHKDDGYNICDKVHCQVYKGKCKNSDILMAAIATRGMALVDSTGEYIIATFHSNCGGQTVSSADVWTKSLPYLRPVTDTYCRDSHNARWEKKILISDWLSYLKRNGCKITDSNKNDYLNFKQPFRKAFFDVNGARIPLKNVRNDLKLKSTFFETFPSGDNIILSGRGFGHGVGLCQEGAMKMALSGFNYLQIIDHYFYKVHISYKQIPD